MTDSSVAEGDKWGVRFGILLGIAAALVFIPYVTVMIAGRSLRWVVLAGAMLSDTLTSRLFGFRLFEARRVDDWRVPFTSLPLDDEALQKWLVAQPCVVESSVVRDQNVICFRCLRRGPLLRFGELHKASWQEACRLGYQGCYCVIVNEPRQF
jgi:hypothetical protein